MKHHPGVAKVWCRWEQTGTHAIEGSHNMTSVSDGGAAGDSDLVYATDMSGDKYVVVATCTGEKYVAAHGGTVATTGVTIICFTSSGAGDDNDHMMMVAFGDQA
jgi:hypothetical protein